MRQTNHRRFYAIMAAVAVLAGSLTACSLFQADQNGLTREEAGTQYQMDLSSLYQNDNEFKKAIAESNGKIDELNKKASSLKTREDLLFFCREFQELSIKTDNLSLYSMLKESVDESDPGAKELVSLSDDVNVRYDRLQNDAVQRIEECYHKQELIRSSFYKENQATLGIFIPPDSDDEDDSAQLSDEIEDVIAQTGLISTSFEEIYSTLTMGENPDIDYYEEGRAANESIINSVASILNGELKKNLFLSKMYGYDSVLEYSLDEDGVPREVYDNLMSSTNKNLAYYKRYLLLEDTFEELKEAMRKDGNPLEDQVKTEYSYREGTAVIKKGLKVLGSDYTKQLDREIDERWIDVYPSETKSTGAFSVNGYTGHPFIVINYDDSFYSVLELAHESGHAINGVYSSQNQPYFYYENPTFTAEVASTMNELLVNRYLLKNADTPEEKLFFTENLLSTLSLTTYDQMMNTEFEAELYRMAEQGEPVSADTITDAWVKISNKYLGKRPKNELETVRYDWSAIPHFYDAFYMYQYATSIAAADQISKTVEKNPENVNRYLDFLKTGSSLSNVDALKVTGIDMMKREVYDQVYSDINDLNRQMEKLIREVGRDYPEIMKNLD